jgi:transposase
VSYAQASKDLGVHPTQLRNWVKQLADDPQHAFPGHGQIKPEQLEIAQLKREVAKLRPSETSQKKPQPTSRRNRCEVRFRCEAPGDLAGGTNGTAHYCTRSHAGCGNVWPVPKTVGKVNRGGRPLSSKAVLRLWAPWAWFDFWDSPREYQNSRRVGHALLAPRGEEKMPLGEAPDLFEVMFKTLQASRHLALEAEIRNLASLSASAAAIDVMVTYVPPVGAFLYMVHGLVEDFEAVRTQLRNQNTANGFAQAG